MILCGLDKAAAPFSTIDNTDLSSLFEPVRPNTSPFDTLRRITDNRGELTLAHSRIWPELSQRMWLSVTAGAVVVMSQALRLRRYTYSVSVRISRVALQSCSADDEFFWRMAARCLAGKRGPVYGVTGLSDCTAGPPWLSFRKRMGPVASLLKAPYEEKRRT